MLLSPHVSPSKKGSLRTEKRCNLSEPAGIIALENMADIDTKTQNDAPPTSRELVAELAQLKAENQWLKEQLGLAKHRLFAPSSEKSPTG